jgi:thiamine kinase-like enzyme
MLPHELESVAARHVPGRGKVDIHRLSEGLVNESYKVLRDGSAYVLRVAAPGHRDLGLDHAWEARVLEGATQGGLAPVIEYSDPQHGIWIARWIDGRSWNRPEVRRPANLSRMAALMQRIHALPVPTPARVMSPRTWIELYGAAAPQAAAALRAAATVRLAALAELPSTGLVLCHSDLHTLNLIDRGDSLVLLDWEYAHAADPFWDLAGWGSNNDLEDALTYDLLASYAGRVPTPQELLRLQLLGWLYDYVCLLWSQLYLNLSGGARSGGAAGRASMRDGVSARAQLLASRLGRTGISAQ